MSSQLQTGQLHAGVARADITPPVGIAHANWGAQAHERAQGVDLPMWATALALSDGNTTTLLIDLDISGLRPENATKVRQAVADRTGLAVGNIRLAYTHTHSGPSTSSSGGWVSGGAELIAGYLESLVAKVAGVAWEATLRLQPARIAAGSGRSTIAVNRRFVTPEKTVVVDVGTNVLPDGSLVGDVDDASVNGVAAALTPVPGGVGSVTTALLLLHTTEAARRQARVTGGTVPAVQPVPAGAA